MAHAPASLLLPPFLSQPLLFPRPVRSVHSSCPFPHHLRNVSGFQLFCELKYFPWEDKQSLVCNSLTRLLWPLYGKSNIHALETTFQILHLDLSWTSKMWFNPPLVMLGSGNEPQLSVTSVIMGEATHTLQCAVLFICGTLQVMGVTCTFEYKSFQINDGLIKTNHSNV